MRTVGVPHDWISSLRIVAGVTGEDVARFLTAREQEDLEVLRVPLRRLERAASRIAGKLLLEQTGRISESNEVEFLKRGDRPAASLRGEPASLSISFTHSRGLGAAAAGDHPVGVDLEMFREIRREMTRFYLSPDELVSADKLGIERPLLHFWSAKEAAFKQTGEFPTLLGIRMKVVGIGSTGLTFEVIGGKSIVETRVIEGAFIVALARSTMDSSHRLAISNR